MFLTLANLSHVCCDLRLRSRQFSAFLGRSQAMCPQCAPVGLFHAAPLGAMLQW